MRFMMTVLGLFLVSVAAAQSPRVPAPGTVGDVSTFNIVQWQGNDLPRIYERSDELPLTDDEVLKLSQAGFAADGIVKMIEQRRCRCDSSADGLIRLKKGGVDELVVSAVARHGLKPNRAIQLSVTMDFIGRAKTPTAGIGGRVRPGFLYFFVSDGAVYRSYIASIAEMLDRSSVPQGSDQTDVMRAKPVRRVQLNGEVPLVNYGPHQVTVVASTRPNLFQPTDLTPAERATSKVYTFEYPRSSLQSRCELRSAYQQDVILANRWAFQGANFFCEWN